MKSHSKVERTSDRDLVVSRTIDAPARLVYEAWTKPELFERWWVPKSAPITLVSCHLDVRVGGGYQLGFRAGSQVVEVFGKYLEVIPRARLVWTNDEGGDDGAITTLTFEEREGRTLVTVLDRYPSKEALDAAIASGSTEGMPVSLAQLEEFLATLRKTDGSR